MLRPGQPGNDGSGPGAGCKQPLGGQGVPRSGRAARGWLGAAPMRGASMQGAAQGSYEPVGRKGAAWEGRGVRRSLAGATTKPRARPNPPEPAAPLPPLLQGFFVGVHAPSLSPPLSSCSSTPWRRPWPTRPAWRHPQPTLPAPTPPAARPPTAARPAAGARRGLRAGEIHVLLHACAPLHHSLLHV